MIPRQWDVRRTIAILVIIALFLGSNLTVYYLFGVKSVEVAPENSSQGEGAPDPADPLPEKMELFVQVLEKLGRSYLEPVDVDRLLEGAVKGMLETLDDPQTVYYDPEQLENFLIETTGRFSGVGVRLGEVKMETWVLTVFPDSPAERAGLRPGDRVIDVDGKPIPKPGLQRAADLLRGPAGTEVRITVERPGADGPVMVTVKRDDVKAETVFSSVKEPGIGYIRITDFERSTGEDFIRLLGAMEESGRLSTGLILDLRDNPGGLLDEALTVAEQLLPEGEITRLVDRRGEVKDIHYSFGRGKPYPIAVLINGESASAAEVIAGALQDRKIALLVGEKTYGKATVQILENLAGGGALKFTVAKYLTPSGRDLHGTGLEPDYCRDLSPAFKYYSSFFPGTLKIGDYGEEVKLLQQMLVELGYAQLVPSGYFNQDTAETLADFQTGCGLEAGGILDNLTALRLRQSMEQLFQQLDPQLKLARDLLLNQNYAYLEGS